MRYMMLIYGVDATIAPSQAEQEAEMAAYNAFGHEATERGVMLSGEGLHPTSAARWEGAHDRWPLRRNEGATGPLLPAKM